MTETPEEKDFPTVSGPGFHNSDDFDQPPPQVKGYRITGQLGRGGMATVWGAIQLSTQRHVALKIMASPAVASKRVQARFEREVELAARLNHPNIAGVYDSGLQERLYYYAMELIQGKHLDDYVSQNKLNQKQILNLMLLVSRAIQHAHENGVIHRDLKPSNIMVTDDGQPHILDFGLAKTYLEKKDYDLTISMEGEMIGTLPYMSPEQAAGRREHMDTRTDVYSLGLILYRLLTGSTAHDLSGTQYLVMKRIAEEDIRRPREVSKSIDKELEALLLKALERDPNQRYTSAGELAKDIENYLNNEPLAARVPTTAYFLAKKISKHRTKITVCLIAFIALIVAAGLELARDKRIKLAADLTLAEQYLDESRFDLALGLALAAQNRYPNNPKVQQILRMAQGTTTLSVNFELGTLTKATLRKITQEPNQPVSVLPIEKLITTQGLDIEPGWHWLEMEYIPIKSEDTDSIKKLEHLLFVHRSTPYTLQIKNLIVGNTPQTDFATLQDAISHCAPGNILLLTPGDYQFIGEVSIPNLTIQSRDHDNLAKIHITGEFRIWSTHDIALKNLNFVGAGPIKQWPGVLTCFDSVYFRLTDCIMDATLFDVHRSDAVRITSNHFRKFIHHRIYIEDSQRIVVNNNTVDSTLKYSVRAMDFVRCRGVMTYDNKIGRSADTAMRVRICPDTLLAANTMTGGKEGTYYIEHSFEAIMCFNNLFSQCDYNVKLWDAQGAFVSHNHITGGDHGIRMSIMNDAVLNHNLITDSNSAFSFSTGHNNVIRKNILSPKHNLIADDISYDFDVKIESNLINANSILNCLPQNATDIKNNNTVKSFETDDKDFLSKYSDFAPNLALKRTALSVFSLIADDMLHFRQKSNDTIMGFGRLDDQLMSKISKLANSNMKIPLPQVDQHNFSPYFLYAQPMQQLSIEPNEIPVTARYFNNHHYLLCPSPLTWKNAKEFCESIGAHLATITDQSEFDWILKTFPRASDLWLGANDEAQEGTFVWITNENWTFANWATGQPDNHMENENYLILEQNGTWQDKEAQMQLPFLIEWDH